MALAVSKPEPAPGTLPGNSLPRSRSSILAFNLREFLKTQHAHTKHPAAKPLTPFEEAKVSCEPRVSLKLPNKESVNEDMVWVDAFFYGFYLEKSKVDAYQASLTASKR
ncbi:hypothetical protein AB1Y20_009553 [Prymnesium parvum]|uniref:Uncharacterized protein n=1 Tax=Prymnesium parvum TaxID=97485 RepID=A0AB34K0M3_PRYPA|mmetsp:Transcript_7570/g.18732  ORF Transcript_7570/g.18732 Transcript_7570/m.18732 type:complete len:109 (-) Transcript_7570:312-638(-)